MRAHSRAGRGAGDGRPHPRAADARRDGLRARELSGAEQREWWDRAVAAYPPYADYVDYVERTGRRRPGFVLERQG